MPGNNGYAVGIVGIGNTIRGDDGIGAYICAQIDILGLRGVKTFIFPQLQVEMVEEFLTFDFIILADAAVQGDPVVFYPLEKNKPASISSSHHINANLLVSLAQQLYDKDLSVMMCAVRGENFDIGNELSTTATNNANRAINIIRHWIESGCH